MPSIETFAAVAKSFVAAVVAVAESSLPVEVLLFHCQGHLCCDTALLSIQGRQDSE